MSESPYWIGSFAVGDYVTFERSYSLVDFDAFSALSGDTNPLHHDFDYAARSPFIRPIVPLHLTLAPLSMIAGMVFPGAPSIYLGHEVWAARPVYYEETLCYSARVEAVNISHRVLTLRVLALRGKEVVLDAVLRVQCHSARWTTPPALPVHKGSQPSVAVVTGATGEIGSAISRALAKRGWRLVLQDRGGSERRIQLKRYLSSVQAVATFVTADLASVEGMTALATAVSSMDDIALIVHAASPLVTASVEELVAVNFTALKRMLDVVLAKLLARQSGTVVLIGSTATEYALPGWEAYAGAKSMAASLISGIERSYASYGVRGLNIMPGLVATRFSESYRGDSPALLPEEVAEEFLRIITDRDAAGNTVLLEVGRHSRGHLGFHELTDTVSPPSVITPVRTEGSSIAKSNGASPSLVAATIRRVLTLAEGTDLTDAGVGITPGWDSLKHIELLLEIESALGINFVSGEIEAAHHFSTLDALCRKKLADKGV
jgi:NADP-dependent 3-hydroxy acid dehydrogenase YdfG/acyl dehydratase/acyl carrier protein